MYPRTEMLVLVLVDGHAKGIIARDLVTGEISAHAADAVVLATGGYGNIFYYLTTARRGNVTAPGGASRKTPPLAEPRLTAISPAIPPRPTGSAVQTCVCP